MKEMLTKIICDRCGNSIYIPAQKVPGLNLYKMAPIPENWAKFIPVTEINQNSAAFILLCPECAKEARKLEKSFLKEVKKAKEE